jgi:flagellar motor switch protein FliM
VADVLDQSEVDALLSAVNTGGNPEPAAAAAVPTPKTALPQPANVSAYDFKRPERISKDQMRAMEAIHEGFARNIGASLSAFLRTIIEVRVATAEQLTFSEFIYSLPNPTCFNLIVAPPLEGQMCLEISPLIIYPIVDRLLGGSNAEMFIPQRPLTTIELRLVRRITDRALESLTEVWSDLVEAQFELIETESNPHLAQIVAPNEVVVVMGFEIKMGARAGTMSLCIPFNVIEPVIGKLAAQSWLMYRRQGTVDNQRDQVSRSLDLATVDVKALMAMTNITMGELLGLQVGDILRTQTLASSELILQIEGKNKFAGRPGQYRGHRALKVTRPADPEETP